MKDQNKKMLILIILVFIICIVIYLLVLKFGYIEHFENKTPTGNTDVFEIAGKTEEETTNTTKLIDKNKQNNKITTKNTTKEIEIITDDIEADEKESNLNWDYTSSLNIFSNPQFEFEKIIAPGSSNSYKFIVKNNSEFAVDYNITFEEENPYKVNMKYSLLYEDLYIVGDKDTLYKFNKLNQKSIHLESNSYDTYELNWKWVDSKNDTKIGELNDVDYKLNINIKATRS